MGSDCRMLEMRGIKIVKERDLANKLTLYAIITVLLNKFAANFY